MNREDYYLVMEFCDEISTIICGLGVAVFILCGVCALVYDLWMHFRANLRTTRKRSAARLERGKMSEIRPWKCDGPGCEALKKETNHWFLLYPFRAAPAFVVNVWEPANASLPGVKHACGEACLLKIVSERIKNASK